MSDILLGELLSREKGYRRLDVNVFLALGWTQDLDACGYLIWRMPNGNPFETMLPAITTSVDAALWLVAQSKGWFVDSMGESVKKQVYAGDKHDSLFHFYCKLQHREGGRQTTEVAKTLPLVICAALYRATKESV